MRMTPERSVDFQPEGKQPCLVSSEDLLRIASQVGAGDRRPVRKGRLPLWTGVAITTALLTACAPGSAPPPTPVVRENDDHVPDPVGDQEREASRLARGLSLGQVVFAKEPEKDQEDDLRIPAPTDEEMPSSTSTATRTPRPSYTPIQQASSTPSKEPTASAIPTESTRFVPSSTAAENPTDTPELTETSTPVVTPGAEVLVERLNVRGGPGTVYDVIGGLNRGARVAVAGRTENGWLKVNWTDEMGEYHEGWISGNPSYVAADEKSADVPLAQGDEIPATPTAGPTAASEPPAHETRGDLYRPDLSKISLPEIVTHIPPFPHEAGITVNTPCHFPDFLWGDRSVEGAHAGAGVLAQVLGIDGDGGVHLLLDLDPGDAQQLKEIVLPVADLPLNFVVVRARQGEQLILSTRDPSVVYALLNRENLFQAQAGEPLLFSILNGYQGRHEIRLIALRISAQTW
jgi:uncharacterized protein YraI